VSADVDIIVPVRNEEASIDELCARVARLGLADRLLFVDNGSTDRTVDRVRGHPEVRLIRHARDEGYGASIRDGIAGSDAEHIVVLDADLEYPPETIPTILAALERHAVVYGSRFLGPDPPAMPLARRLGNRIVSTLFNVLFGQRTTDLYTGMKGLRRSLLPLSSLRRSGFEHGVELAALVARSGHRIHEVPVAYRPRIRGRSKMRHLPEAVKLVSYLLLYRLRRPRAGARRTGGEV
jgi:glycosyltransferase involved in cell wall biosynthesis